PGASHTCALKQDDRVFCWGSRVFGQTGEGILSLPQKPQPIGNATWKSVASFGEDGCALNAAGELTCWGNNESGQLGAGDTVSRDTAVDAMTAEKLSAVSLGRQHACGI